MGRQSRRRGYLRGVGLHAPRPGIGDITAKTGLATSWNPMRDRGHGADHLLITPAGPLVASDTCFGAAKCGGVYHPGICLLLPRHGMTARTPTVVGLFTFIS